MSNGELTFDNATTLDGQVSTDFYIAPEERGAREWQAAVAAVVIAEPAPLETGNDAVVAALVSHYRVDAGRLRSRGVASLAPVATNRVEAGRAKNRRVERVEQ